MIHKRVPLDFYVRDVLDVAPELPGKMLVRKLSRNRAGRFMITEVEAYKGPEDLACHASRGKTARTSVMFGRGGHLYVYLIYGIYWMLNIVTGPENDPQAVLIRGLKGMKGPGVLTRELAIGKSFYGEDLCTSGRIWIEDGVRPSGIKTSPRIGVDYAGDYWKSRPWRWHIDERGI